MLVKLVAELAIMVGLVHPSSAASWLTNLVFLQQHLLLLLQLHQANQALLQDLVVDHLLADHQENLIMLQDLEVLQVILLDLVLHRDYQVKRQYQQVVSTLAIHSSEY